ncbi:hypothetical protein V1503_14210 [Bacillus sp. SCS-151]|uniref:hypothetical protein n=1 Tax=Nanhaiella sioensis TaxID=3115293 RepID=UPI00397A2789
MKKIFSVLFISILSLVLFGCNASIEEEITQTKDQMTTLSQSEPSEPNKSNEQFSYFLPDNMRIEDDESLNNIVFIEGKQQYILFVNPQEDVKSKVLYEDIKKSSGDNIIDETIESDEDFTYTVVNQTEDKSYEVTVGIGGVKMTTVTKANAISESAEKMLNIVKSVSVK